MSSRPLLAFLLAMTPLTAQVRAIGPPSPEQLVKDGAVLSPAAADRLEAQLQENAEDLPARTKLLGYYFYQWMRPGEAASKAARRRHILWIVQNRPGDQIAGLNEVVIFPTGDSLADPDGYRQARELWLSQMEARKGNAPLLGNLSKFFQLSDKDLAESALKRAQEADSSNGEWGWRLGYLYAMGILGVDAVGLNAQPTSVDPYARDGPFAIKARKELAASRDPLMLAVAGSMLSRYGTMLAPSEKVKLDYLEESERLVERAQLLEPANPNWTQFLLQLKAWKQQILAPERK